MASHQMGKDLPLNRKPIDSRHLEARRYIFKASVEMIWDLVEDQDAVGLHLPWKMGTRVRLPNAASRDVNGNC